MFFIYVLLPYITPNTSLTPIPSTSLTSHPHLPYPIPNTSFTPNKTPPLPHTPHPFKFLFREPHSRLLCKQYIFTMKPHRHTYCILTCQFQKDLGNFKLESWHLLDFENLLNVVARVHIIKLYERYPEKQMKDDSWTAPTRTAGTVNSF